MFGFTLGYLTSNRSVEELCMVSPIPFLKSFKPQIMIFVNSDFIFAEK